MKLVTLQPVEGAQKKVDIKVGKTIIGRGPLLECGDKKVSRNHALLEVQENGDVFLTPTHVNPCFFLPNDSKGGFEVLKKDCPQRIRDGDSFSLLPNSFRYRVIISDVVDYESVDKDDGVGTKKDAASASQGTSATGSGGVNKKEVGSHSSEPSLLNGDKKDREKESATGAHDSVGGQLSDLSSSAATPHGQPKDNGKPAPLKNGLSPGRSRRSDKLAHDRDNDFGKEHSPVSRAGHKKSHLLNHVDRTSPAGEITSSTKNPDAQNNLGSKLSGLARESVKDKKNNGDQLKVERVDDDDDVEGLSRKGDVARTSSLTPSKGARSKHDYKSESVGKLSVVAANATSTLCSPPSTPTNANRSSPLATKKILSDKSTSGKKDGAARDAKESKPDPEKQSKLKNFDFDEDDDEPQTTTTATTTTTTTTAATTKPVAIKKQQQQILQQQQQQQQLKGKKFIDKSLNSSSATAATGLGSGRKGTTSTKDALARRRSSHSPPTNSGATGSSSLNTSTGTATGSQSRSTRTNRTLIQRISLDDFMASDDEWIATYASSDDERKKAKKRQHHAKRKSATTGADTNSDSDDWEGVNNRKTVKKRAAKRSLKRNDDDSAVEEDSDEDRSPPKKGRGRVAGRKASKKSVEADSEEDPPADSDEEEEEEEEDEESPKKEPKGKKFPSAKAASPAKEKIIAVPPKKKVVRRKKSHLYAENEEDFQRQLARAIRESKKEQLRKEREERERATGNGTDKVLSAASA